jgi:hypothetical protein
VHIPIQVKHVKLKDYSLNDTLHILMEMEYILLILSTLETYFQFFHLQTCMWLGIAPLMIDAKIMARKFYLMWNIEDMEFKEWFI